MAPARTLYNDPRARLAQRRMQPEDRDPQARWCVEHGEAWVQCGEWATCPECLRATYVHVRGESVARGGLGEAQHHRRASAARDVGFYG